MTTSKCRTRCFVGMLAFVTYAGSANTQTFSVKQVLTDGIDGVDGLDNPRQIALSQDQKHGFVVSADDNSVLILDVTSRLTPLSVFKSIGTSQAKLEGASGVTSLHHGAGIAVTSFYDGAVSLFSRGTNGEFRFSKVLSDNLGFERVFKRDEPLGDADKLGLLGAWGLVATEDNKQLFVASYKSNGVAVLSRGTSNAWGFSYKFALPDAQPEGLGGPVGLSFSDTRNELVVAGYNNHSLTVLARGSEGQLSLRQTLHNDKNGVVNMLNPQKIVHDKKGEHLYVASSGSNAIVVFGRTNDEYHYLKSVTHTDTGGSGLAGVGSLALSADGKTLFAAGEFDQGLVVFDVEDDGQLRYRNSIQSDETPIAGVTSIAVSPDGQRLYLTLGKADALYVLERTDP